MPLNLPRLPDGPPLLLTPAEAAHVAGVGVAALSRWEKNGKAHPVRLPSGQRRYLDAEMRARRAGTPLTVAELAELHLRLVSGDQ